MEKGEARRRYQRKTRHAQAGENSITPRMRDVIFACAMLAISLCIMWSFAMMYETGYSTGYQTAKAAYHA